MNQMADTSDASTGLLAALLDSSDDAILAKTPEGIITTWNHGAERLYGYSAAEMMGRSVSMLMNPERPAEMSEILAKVGRGERIHNLHTTRMCRDGRIVSISLSVFPIYGQGGLLTGMGSIGRDITEQRRVYVGLSAERERLFSVLETLPAMICLLKSDHHVAFANRAYREKFGNSAGRHCYEYRFHLTAPCSFCESYSVLQTGQPHNWEFEVPDGSLISCYVIPFTDVDGSRTILEMDVDITESVRTKRALEKASAYNRTLIEASLDPLVTISPDGKITDVNQATIKVTGVAREELVGTDFSNYFINPDEAREAYRRVFTDGFVTDFPLTVRNASRSEVLYNACVYRDEGGQVQGVFAAARDVTARKRAEAELAAQRARELERLAELERFQRLTVGRELKMIELKKELAELRGKFSDGQSTQ